MGIFDDQVGLFTRYRATLQFRDRIVGGIPKDPKIIEGWLKARAGLDDGEARMAMLRTVNELGANVDLSELSAMSFDDLLAQASAAVAGEKQTNGFKRDDGGLYIESRIIKAAIKEVTNILYAGERWGATKKGPKSFVAERVFISPDRIHLGVMEPSGVDLAIVHASGPRGPQSSLNYYEYVERPRIEFDVMVVRDAVENQNWPEIWALIQENGLGAMRSQGFGRSDIEQWDVVAAEGKKLKRVS